MAAARNAAALLLSTSLFVGEAARVTRSGVGQMASTNEDGANKLCCCAAEEKCVKGNRDDKIKVAFSLGDVKMCCKVRSKKCDPKYPTELQDLSTSGALTITHEGVKATDVCTVRNFVTIPHQEEPEESEDDEQPEAPEESETPVEAEEEEEVPAQTAEEEEEEPAEEEPAAEEPEEEEPAAEEPEEEEPEEEEAESEALPAMRIIEFPADAKIMTIDGVPSKCCCRSNIKSNPGASSAVVCELVAVEETDSPTNYVPGCKALKGPGFHSWNNMPAKYESLNNYGECAVF